MSQKNEGALRKPPRRGPAVVVNAGPHRFSLPEGLKSAWLAPLVLALIHVGMFWLYVGDRSSGTNSAWTGFPLDDAWIHLVYARSLAEGGGFAYNPGQFEAGFTSPLWVIAITPLYWLSGFNDAVLVAAVKLLGTLLSFAGSLWAFRIGKHLGGPVAGWTAALLLALDPALGFARVSGMEVPLAVAVCLWSLLSLVERKPVRAGVGLACCSLARPELALFVLLALPVLFLQVRGASTRTRLAALLPAPLAAAAWAAYNLWATGRPLPSTFYVKAHLANGTSAVSGLGMVGRMIADLPGFTYGIGIPLLGLGAFALIRARRIEAIPLVGTAILLPLAVACGTRLLEPGAFYWHRYFMPAIPFLYLIVALAAGEARRWRREGKPVLAGAIAALLLTGAAFLPSKWIASSALYSWNTQNINEVQVALGKWVAENLPPDETVAVNDAGAIRYFGGRRTLDLVGLNDHEVQQEGMAAVLARSRPRFYALFPSWYPGVEADPGMRPIQVARSPHYTICDCAQETMVVYERTYGE